MVLRAESHGSFLHDRRALVLTLGPALARLSLRRTRRIFQDRTSLDVAAELLTEWRVPFRAAVHRPPPVRGYCVQYDETDLAFLTRLFAEDGLFYFFEHPLTSPAEVLVIADEADDYPPIAGDPHLRFERVQADDALRAREDHVSSFVARARVRAARTLERGYDFRRPDVELRGEASVATPDERRVRYEHEGAYEEDLGAGASRHLAVTRLEQARKKAHTAEGASFCRRLVPGSRFSLTQHDVAALDGAWAVTHVEHEGYAAEVTPPGKASYQNRLRCVPADVAYRPTHRAPKPRQVAETAVVVAPPLATPPSTSGSDVEGAPPALASGADIHTDAHGRVKVQFHWDLHGARDDKSSCWLRVAQAWAGAGWGAQFIPRVGMEVVVTFLGGDVDRPLVTGCVYNATHTPPFALPEGATRSGLRTQSVPGGGGANELSFEDALGREQVYLHAQRSYDEVIRAGRSSRVGGGSSVAIGGRLDERVEGEVRMSAGASRETRVEHHERLSVGKRLEVEVGGDHTLLVGGELTTRVSFGHLLEVEGSHSLVVGSPESPGQSDHQVHGSATLAASERVLVRADQGLTLVCGDARIELSRDTIALRAPTIELAASETLTARAKDGPTLTVADDVEILAKKLRVFTESAALELDKEAKVKGDKIKLGYQPDEPEKSADEAEPETRPLELKLSDWFMAPYANKTYHLHVEGLRFEGKTDAEGTLKRDIPKAAKQVTVRLWVDEYPEGRRRFWRVNLAALPPASEPKGAQQRLKNLGYYQGNVDGGDSDEYEDALREFQVDHRESHDLEPTGALDGATAGALEEVHGS